jgi:DNA-binding MarR family transcriptional regulator
MPTSAVPASSSDARPPRESARRATLIDDIREQVRAFRAAARRSGYRHLLGQAISLTHLHALTVVQMDGPLPVSELARVLGVSVASATGIVSRMEERGLVRRTRGAADRRVVTVELAPGGTAALDEIEGRSREGLRRMLATLSVDELEQVRGGLSALQRAQQSVSSSKPDPRP